MQAKAKKLMAWTAHSVWIMRHAMSMYSAGEGIVLASRNDSRLNTVMHVIRVDRRANTLVLHLVGVRVQVSAEVRRMRALWYCMCVCETEILRGSIYIRRYSPKTTKWADE